MPTTRPMSDVEIKLDWEPSSKRWRLEWSMRVGRGRARHWLWIESSAPVETPDVAKWCEDVRRDLESRLF